MSRILGSGGTLSGGCSDTISPPMPANDCDAWVMHLHCTSSCDRWYLRNLQCPDLIGAIRDKRLYNDLRVHCDLNIFEVYNILYSVYSLAYTGYSFWNRNLTLGLPGPLKNLDLSHRQSLNYVRASHWSSENEKLPLSEGRAKFWGILGKMKSSLIPLIPPSIAIAVLVHALSQTSCVDFKYIQISQNSFNFHSNSAEQLALVEYANLSHFPVLLWLLLPAGPVSPHTHHLGSLV